MYSSKAFVPLKINQQTNQFVASAAFVTLGVIMLALLAQVKITLAWTPVPITGQTFGVSLLALAWGSRLSGMTFVTYLSAGFLGAPVFAGGAAGLSVGPTFGYLVGMFVASMIVGHLSDRGWSSSFKKAIMACYIGSFLTFTCGLIGLSFFIPKEHLLTAGLLPFLPGDLIKNTLAANLMSRIKLD